MDEKKIAEQISSILPDRTNDYASAESRHQAISAEAKNTVIKHDAKEIARQKYLEKTRLKREQDKLEKMQAEAERLGVPAPVGTTINQMNRIVEQQARVDAIEAIEEQNNQALSPTTIAQKGGNNTNSLIGQALQLQGASRADITKLLTSLNINLSVRLTKSDTANLLACLLTCNESQLHALMNNKKIPVVIKTVIKRLLEDMKLGNIDTVERLWDRIFGKGAMQLDLPPQTSQLEQGILPNTPISREAYIVIRDTLIK